ncbi:MAG TPA: ABC transporter ATP-binding protein [Syntrophaceticus sp.]|nr:ABC transporter ATP-binding protein [Syntrophaceticus sp.]
MEEQLLTVNDLHISYGDADVVSQVSFSVKKGEIVCIVGESGCGKSSVLKAILGLPSLETVVTGGSIVFEGRELTSMNTKQRCRLMGVEIGFVPQNPGSSFNPVRSYEQQFRETLSSHGRRFDQAEVLDCFEKLHLTYGADILKSYPYEMSGGMNQRIAIALAMLLRPKLLLCDEVTSALDVTTQKLVVEELMQFRENCGTAILFVTHNLGVAAKMADIIIVMYAGHLMEYGQSKKVLKTPAHPYTKCLMVAVPDFSGELPCGLDGQPPLEGATMETCAFEPRCPYAGDMPHKNPYKMKQVSDGHFSCCTGRA